MLIDKIKLYKHKIILYLRLTLYRRAIKGMKQVSYAKYYNYLGNHTYKYNHLYGVTNHTTEVIEDGYVIAKIVRFDHEIRYFIGE